MSFVRLTVDLAAHQAIINEYDVLGVVLPRSKKVYDANLDPEMIPIIEQRRKDRLVCYVLALVCRRDARRSELPSPASLLHPT